jgi:hypothetical protein
VNAFATRLKGTVDLDSVREDLAGVVYQTLVSQALSRQDPGEGLRAAEDRGFEPRRVVTPNRISSAAP